MYLHVELKITCRDRQAAPPSGCLTAKGAGRQRRPSWANQGSSKSSILPRSTQLHSFGAGARWKQRNVVCGGQRIGCTSLPATPSCDAQPAASIEAATTIVPAANGAPMLILLCLNRTGSVGGTVPLPLSQIPCHFIIVVAPSKSKPHFHSVVVRGTNRRTRYAP